MDQRSEVFEARKAIVGLVRDWVANVTTTKLFIERYWPLRRCVLDKCPEVFTGRFGELCSNLETAVGIYAEEPEQPYELDEKQLRHEAELVFPQLAALVAAGQEPRL
jgi:hypothetical protein